MHLTRYCTDLRECQVQDIVPVIPARQHQIVDQTLQSQAWDRGRPERTPTPGAPGHPSGTSGAPDSTAPGANAGTAALE